MKGFVERIPRPLRPNRASLDFSKFFGAAIPVAEMVIGSMCLGDCPAQPYIPFYMIVSGGFGLMLVLLICMPFSQKPEDGTSNPINRVCVMWNSLLCCFLFCWFIAGNVWIYSIYEPEYTRNSTNVDVYCNKTLYLFSFWSTTVGYILFGVMLVFCCFLMVYVCLVAEPTLTTTSTDFCQGGSVCAVQTIEEPVKPCERHFVCNKTNTFNLLCCCSSDRHNNNSEDSTDF